MQTVSIEISNDLDLKLLILLARRLGWKVVKPTNLENDLDYHLKVIEAGTSMSEEKMNEMLKWHEEDRKDRELPFRSS